MATKRRSTSERFWSYVDKTDGCWVWRSPNPNGYGHFRVSGSGANRVRAYAHRWAYEQLRGPIPEEMTIDHLCRNRACVRPDHLEVVTFQENHARRRGIKHGPRDLGDVCRRGHERSLHTAINSQGYRYCRACARENQARYHASSTQ